MKPNLPRVARFALALVVLGGGLLPSPGHAKCPKDCKRALATASRSCKKACVKGKPGKACRMACTAELRAARTTCRAAVDPTPPSCGGTTGGGTTTTTLAGSPGMVVKGALTATPGRFNYNLTLGLPGANAACDTRFTGSHACTLTELQAAPASDLAGLRDTAGTSVTSFWAIDSSANPLQQCQDDVAGGSGLNWEYATAHTASRGEKIALTNATGVLGSLETSVQCNLSGNAWVGCCQ